MAVTIFRKLTRNSDKKKRNWAWFSIVSSGITLLILLILEITVIVNNSLFFDRGITKELSGASPIINVYYSLFLLGVAWQFGMAVESSYSKNTMQVLAVAVFNLILVAFSGIRICY
jgi:hypothetical protein